ncbi:MAG: hypothetical protein AAF717_00260 [Bacteroidota bacterium]
MPRNRDLVALRNTNIKKRYHELCAKHKEWRNDAIIAKVAGEFYLAPNTIDAIINERGIYGQDTQINAQLRLL